ncbi:pyridoxal phosphate-dependent transferase [Dunaliella salina]|uniref:Pyridoxal phosphate-dependent transferase n=1 Tax=Dunaliella salina TaxID=3046 RepID=A0ABQ7GZK9_DUNSA|nr:pyridoxal phosphate-dependent transferase [Dunaliella salina]|eukprot:KAF5840053.1 pyridoxal phosphate-dependent transferase [Dunaliella salina]
MMHLHGGLPAGGAQTVHCRAGPGAHCSPRPVQLGSTAPFCTSCKDLKRAVMAHAVDQTINPAVAALKPSKTMALTDLALSMKEQGADVMDNGLDYAVDEVLVSNGAKQSIWQALLATCSPGDEVIIPAPYWVSYPEMATMAGAKPVIIPTTPQEGFLMSAEKLRAAMTPRSRLLILCTPSNPTGSVYPRELLEALAEVVRDHPRLLVLSDEIYEYITYAPAQHHSFGALPGMWERTLTVNGFSKAYAMTGWRLGYLAGPRHFVKAASTIQSQSTSGASSIAQHAALAALNLGPHGGAPVAGMVEAFRERKDMIVAKLRTIPGVNLAEPEGAFYVLPEMSAFFGPGAEAVGWGPVPDSDAFCRYLIEKANVAVVPGEAFGAETCIRISYAASLETLTTAMDRIVAALAPGAYRLRTGA